MKECEENEEGYKEYQDKLYNYTINRINKMTKKELVQDLIHIFDIAPEWIYTNYLRDKDIQYDFDNTIDKEQEYR